MTYLVEEELAFFGTHNVRKSRPNLELASRVSGDEVLHAILLQTINSLVKVRLQLAGHTSSIHQGPRHVG